MSTDFLLHAKGRDVSGKGASRRLRRLAGEIPAIVYGGQKEPQSLTLVHKDVLKALENEAFYSNIITLTIDDKAEEVVLKDLQRHPAKLLILHMDFLRVSKSTMITLKVPLRFVNEDICVGVKNQGGVISHTVSDLEVQCLPKNLPEFIEVDLATLELGATLHISDIVMPKGVESVALNHGADHDLSVAAVNKSKSRETTSDEVSDDTES
ncbi:MAG TPA: 50S ribosomal protein L25 [Porticoccaceae bacterium]|nr:50S ribosomal protein L25 [Porticoccaceae bacterium]